MSQISVNKPNDSPISCKTLSATGDLAFFRRDFSFSRHSGV